jgi:DNA-binding LacI/PurR family transcriptional regulator
MSPKVSAKLEGVAALAGVSTATVSRVLNHPQLVKDSTQTAVRAAMESLSYERNEIAASLRTQNTRTLAGVIADVTNPFFPAVLSGLQAAADRAGYLLLLVGQPGDPDGLSSVLRQLQRRQVSGIVLLGLHEGAMPDSRVFGDTPRVIVDRRLDIPDSMWVGVDHLEAARPSPGKLI